MAKAVLWSPGAVCCEKQPEATPLATPSLIFSSQLFACSFWDKASLCNPSLLQWCIVD